MAQLITNLLLTFIIYLLVANSFAIIYSTCKIFHIAHAAIITIGAYITYLFSNQIGLNLPLSIVFSILTCIGLGTLINKFLYKILRIRRAASLVFLISSLGIYLILQNIISIIWGDDIKILRKTVAIEGNELFGAYITEIQLIIIIVSISLILFMYFFLSYTKVGLKIKAVSANNELANIIGINSEKIITLSFIIGSFLASIAGILYGFDINISPTMGFNLLLYGVVAMIIGGVGSTWGLIGGSLLLATAQHLGAYYIDSKWMEAIAYIILILFLIWKPLGFSGKRLKKIEI